MFAGNSDRNTVVFNRLYPSFHGRYVRFYPKQWHSFIAMRIELYGCNRGKDRKTRLYWMYLLMVKESNFIPLESLSCNLQESRFSDSMFECVQFAVVSSNGVWPLFGHRGLICRFSINFHSDNRCSTIPPFQAQDISSGIAKQLFSSFLQIIQLIRSKPWSSGTEKKISLPDEINSVPATLGTSTRAIP